MAPFALHAETMGGQEVHQFLAPLTVRYAYTAAQLAARGIAGADDLTLFWYDPAGRWQIPGTTTAVTGRWTPVPTQVDRAAHVVTAQVDHFSIFQFADGSSPSSDVIPTVDGWQVSPFTGAATYSLPFSLPSGPGGLKPALALSYTSAQTDGKNGQRPNYQAGWAGKGWSLGNGYVARRKITNTPPPGFVESYTLNLGDREYDLVNAGLITFQPDDQRPDHYYWVAASDPYLKVVAVSTLDGYGLPANHDGNHGGTPYTRTTWQITTRDGTRYDYQDDLWWGLANCTYFLNGDGSVNHVDGASYLEPYRWNLTKVTDRHGNTITYAYGHVSNGAQHPDCGDASGTTDVDSWPSAITWGGNPTQNLADHYRVIFASTDRGGFDAQADGDGTQYDAQWGGHPRQTRNLQAVEVDSRLSGSTWSVLAQWRIALTADIYSDATVDGANTPIAPQQYKYRILSIQRFGTDATPITEDPVHQQHSLPAGAGGTPLPAQTFTYHTDRGMGEFAAGGWNRLAMADNGEGGTVAFTYAEIGGVYAGQSLGAAGRNFRNYHRVTARTVTDGLGGSAVWNYAYQNPEMNSPGVAADPFGGDVQQDPNSAKRYYAFHGGGYGDALLAVPTRSEFRGHAQVTVTDPAGNVTKHFFYQGDLRDAGQATCTLPNPVDIYSQDPCFIQLRNNEFFRGDEYRTEVWQAGGVAPLRVTQRRFALHEPSFGCGASQCISGFWQGFVYTNQVTTTVADGAATGASATTRYTYTDPDGNIDAYGDLRQVDEYQGAPPNGPLFRTTRYEYAMSGSRYLVLPARTTVTGSGGGTAVMDYLYDGQDEGSRGILSPSGPADLTHTVLGTHETAYTYDAYGNQVTRSTFTQGNGNTAGDIRTTTTDYDAVLHALPITVTYPQVAAGRFAESASYDPLGRGLLTQVTDLNGRQSTATYDLFGRLVTVAKPYDSDAAPTLHAYYFDYNAATHEPAHYIAAIRDTGGANGLVHYVMTWTDGRGRTVQTKRESAYGAQTIVTDRQYLDATAQVQVGTPRYKDETAADTFFTYDPPSMANPAALWTTTTADALGRPTLVVAPDASQTQTSYTASAQGEIAATIDANGHKTDHETDVFGRGITTHEYTGDTGSGFTLYATTSATYDALDRRLTLTDAKGAQTTWSYSGYGGAVTTTIADPDTGASVIETDVNDNVVRTRDANGHVIGSGYDAWDRLVAQSGDLTASYTYDSDATPGSSPVGRLVTAVSGPSNAPLTTTHTVYDYRGRPTTVTQTIGNDTASFATAYDSGDRVTARTYPGPGPGPNGEVVQYSYDAAGRPTQACAQALGLCYAQNASYTALSQPARETLGNGLAEVWQYDATTQRLNQHQVGTTLPASGVADRFDRGYAYDLVGNLTRIALNTNGDVQSFAYDARDRLTSATDVAHPEWAETDSYDNVGNLTSKGGVSYQYGTSGHAHAPQQVGGAVYAYDAMGQTLTGGVRSFAWNAQGLPTSVTTNLTPPMPTGTPNLTAPRGGMGPAGSPNLTEARGGLGQQGGTPNLTAPRTAIAGASVESYTYDASGSRLTRTAGGITTSYFGLYEKDSTGVERWYYSMGGSTIAQREKTSTSDNRVWLTGDHLGSVTLVTGDAASHGSVVSDTEYSAWGQERGGSGTKPTALDYTGAHRDGTGLVYLGSRYYDPVLGRFLSPDSVVDGVNPYSYVHNNPLNATDPTGHSDCSDECNNPNSPGGTGNCSCSGQYGGYTGVAGLDPGNYGNYDGGGGGYDPGSGTNPAAINSSVADANPVFDPPTGEPGVPIVVDGHTTSVVTFGFSNDQRGLITTAVQIQVGGYGSLQNFTDAIGGGIDVYYGGAYGNNEGYYDPSRHIIALYEAAFTDTGYNKMAEFNAVDTIIHEFGHAVDDVSHGTLSNGTYVAHNYDSTVLMQNTGGRVITTDDVNGGPTSQYVTTKNDPHPSSYSYSNQYEDFAESYAAYFVGARDEPYASTYNNASYDNGGVSYRYQLINDIVHRRI